MPEPAQNTANLDGNNAGGSTSTAGAAFTPITSQEDLNRVIADRISRERSKFADYDDLKAAATRLAEIEQASKSDLEKAQEAAATANATAAKAQQDALRMRVALTKGLPATLVDRLHGTNEQELTADAEELLKLVAPAAAQQSAAPRPDLTQGTGSGGATASPAADFAAFLGKQLTH